MNIGKSIKQIRVGMNVNQKSFSVDLGISQSYLSQIENGHKKPSFELLERIAEAVDLALPIMFWFGVEESDVSDDKLELFRLLKGPIDSMLASIIPVKHSKEK